MQDEIVLHAPPPQEIPYENILKSTKNMNICVHYWFS